MEASRTEPGLLRSVTAETPEAESSEAAIAALEAVIERAALRLSVAESTPAGHPASRAVVRIESGSAPVVSISVDDEYGDSEGHPAQPLLLHLVLAECEGWEEADDFPAWAVDAELDPADPGALGVFEDLARVVPEIRRIVGDVRAISSWEVQMNSGAARALRERSE